MKYHAFLSIPDPGALVSKPEKELMASSWERLREFIEAYWTCYNLSEESWQRLLNGDAVYFTTVGTIHLEEDD